MRYTFKHNLKSFEMLMNKLKLDPQNCILFEDNPDNLNMAKKFKMTTVLITQDNSPNNFDYTYPDIKTALKNMFSL